MKKNFILLIILGLFLLTGCSGKDDDIIKKFKNKTKRLNSYHIEGLLEVINNEISYKYDIDVSYEKDEKYRVKLKNKTNDHEQIILKNNDGIYVLTPSLNKSFKFQSEWPYNNSQSYLYQNIINDIENDDKTKTEKTKDGYIIITKVNYSNNKDLINQKIYLDNDINIKKVEVLDKNGIIKIKMEYKKVEKNPSFDNNYFQLSNNINIKEQNNKKESETANILDVSYPLYIPENTKLTSQETIDNRTILTFSGEKPFTIIEEMIKNNDINKTISVSGDLDFVNDVIGSIEDDKVNWISNGVEYYAVSKEMDSSELLEVVNSMNTITVGK